MRSGRMSADPVVPRLHSATASTVELNWSRVTAAVLPWPESTQRLQLSTFSTKWKLLYYCSQLLLLFPKVSNSITSAGGLGSLGLGAVCPETAPSSTTSSVPARRRNRPKEGPYETVISRGKGCRDKPGQIADLMTLRWFQPVAFEKVAIYTYISTLIRNNIQRNKFIQCAYNV